MSLEELTAQLDRFSRGELELGALRSWFEPILAADPLDIEQSTDAPWGEAANETRLFWRLIHLFDSGGSEEPLRAHAERVVACLASTGDAGTSLELLPILLDQDRLVEIIRRHLAGVITRTGFLSVVAESGYPPHAKLWLERAPAAALQHLGDLLREGRYRDVVSAMQRRPE